MNTSRNRASRVSALLELALVGTFLAIPLTLGTMTVGMTLARTLRVYHLNRSAGHMFARGVDFSQPAGRALLVRMASGLNITDTGGTGAIVLSEIDCTSTGQAVCTRRLVIGKAGLRSSAFANPTKIDSNGNVDYTHDTAAVATKFLTLMTMSPGDVAYVVETYVSSADYDWAGFLPGNGTYTYGVF